MILKKIDNTQTKPRLVSINPLHYLCTKQRKRKVEQDFLNSLNDQQREAVLYTDDRNWLSPEPDRVKQEYLPTK